MQGGRELNKKGDDAENLSPKPREPNANTPQFRNMLEIIGALINLWFKSIFKD